MKSLHAVLGCATLAVAVHGAETPPAPDVAAPEFRPVTLADCYARTLAHNPDIAKARLEIEEATGTKLVLTSRVMPRVNLRGTAGYSGGTLYDTGGPYAMVRGDLAQPLFDAGIPASLRRGKIEVAIAQQTLNRAVTEHLHATRSAYLQALLCRKLLEAQRQIEQHLQANLRGAQQQFEVGKAGRQAVQQAEIQLLNLKPQIAKTYRAYLAATTDLAERTHQRITSAAPADNSRGQPSPTGRLQLPEPAGNLEYARLAIEVEKETAQTIARRPDLALLREMIRAAEEDRRIIKSGYFPFVSLVAISQYVPKEEVYLRRPEITPGQDARSTETRYGVTFTWQVIDTGKVTGPKRQIESAKQALEITLRRLEENVPRELAVLIHELDTVEAKFTGLKQSLGEAEELLKLVETRVALGAATQLDFLNAQNNLLSTQTSILQAVFENEMARAEFDRVTGRYLDFPDRAAK